MTGITIRYVNGMEQTFYLENKEQVDNIIKDFITKTTKVLLIKDGQKKYIIVRDNVAWIAV